MAILRASACFRITAFTPLSMHGCTDILSNQWASSKLTGTVKHWCTHQDVPPNARLCVRPTSVKLYTSGIWVSFGLPKHIKNMSQAHAETEMQHTARTYGCRGCRVGLAQRNRSRSWMLETRSFPDHPMVPCWRLPKRARRISHWPNPPSRLSQPMGPPSAPSPHWRLPPPSA